MKYTGNESLFAALAQHKLWIESASYRGALAILDDCDLSYRILKDVNLSDASLSRARFQGCNLYGADFRGACMQDADLTGCDLRNVDLRGANLCGVDVLGSFTAGIKFDPCWAIVAGKFVRTDERGPGWKADSAKPTDDQTEKHDFAFKFDIASKLIDAMKILPEKDRRDILTVVCKKFGVKVD
jgi:hypothetical protein